MVSRPIKAGVNKTSSNSNRKQQPIEKSIKKFLLKSSLNATIVINILIERNTISGVKKAKRFFKTDTGQYSADDLFLGIPMPDIRCLAKFAKDLAFDEISILLQSQWHEVRMLGIVILQQRYRQTTYDDHKKEIYEFTIKNLSAINNWDLVDTAAPQLIGDFLLGKSKQSLYQYMKHESLWIRRIAIVATLPSIKNGDFKEIFSFARMSLQDDQDLIHKACGWMLREVGKKDMTELEKFLSLYHLQMPRTMLRYSIEKMSPSRRNMWLRPR